MLFNSLDFAFFLPIVFFCYWFILSFNLKVQNFFLLIASYIFYGWWDYRFLSLIIFSTLLDYFAGIFMGKEEDEKKRRLILLISLTGNLGLLGFYKYFNFFITEFSETFSFFGVQLDSWSLQIILPVGISFYTFQTLSYTIEVYKKTIQPIRNFIIFAAFISFFPQLVAGPIERASHLLPQFSKKRKFEYSEACEGLRQILWGLFKKVVIADNCAEYVNIVFSDPSSHNSSILLLAAILFAFQIYGDFSGYSDIAIGTSRLFGFNLMQNFAYPYFSRNIPEFWRRWHISLSTWFRDYVYIPLGGNRGSTKIKIRNILIVFLLSGFWHGANWTFVFWGFLNALYFLPVLIWRKKRNYSGVVAANAFLPNLKELSLIISTFFLTVLTWIFFRSPTVHDAFYYLGEMWNIDIFSIPHLDASLSTKILISLIGIMLLVEWNARKKLFGLSHFASDSPLIVRWGFYAFLICCTGMYMHTEEIPFIYFQF